MQTVMTLVSIKQLYCLYICCVAVSQVSELYNHMYLTCLVLLGSSYIQQLLSTECDVVESGYSDTQQARNHPISEPGVFLIPEPISCNGTQVTINAEGFCPLSGRTESHSAVFRLLVFKHINDTFKRVATTTVNVNCENSDGSGVSDIYSGRRADYSEGNVNNQTANLNICSGCYLAVRFNSICNENSVCPFQPTNVNSSNRHVLHFQNPSGMIKNIEDGKIRNISFLFTANIISKIGNGIRLCS